MLSSVAGCADDADDADHVAGCADDADDEDEDDVAGCADGCSPPEDPGPWVTV